VPVRDFASSGDILAVAGATWNTKTLRALAILYKRSGTATAPMMGLASTGVTPTGNAFAQPMWFGLAASTDPTPNTHMTRWNAQSDRIFDSTVTTVAADGYSLVVLTKAAGANIKVHLYRVPAGLVARQLHGTASTEQTVGSTDVWEFGKNEFSSRFQGRALWFAAWDTSPSDADAFADYLFNNLKESLWLAASPAPLSMWSVVGSPLPDLGSAGAVETARNLTTMVYGDMPSGVVLDVVGAHVAGRLTFDVVANTTTHALTLPLAANVDGGALQAGDIIMVECCLDGTTTVTPPAGAGWTENTQFSTGSAAADRYGLWWRRVTTEAPGDSIGSWTSSSEAGGWIVTIVRGAYPTGDPFEVSTLVSGTATNPDPPSFDPSWDLAAERTLLFAVDCMDGNVAAPTAAPTNYLDLHSAGWVNANGARLTKAWRNGTAATGAEDPATFTAASANRSAFVVAVRSNPNLPALIPPLVMAPMRAS
jgi:hypothetical protein